MTNEQKLNKFFQNFAHKFAVEVPSLIAETAVEEFKKNFVTKSYDGVAWAKTKRPNNRGSLMLRSGALMQSIRPSVVSPNKVTISAGSSKVPYAKVHNEGGMIERASRSETFRRNRYTSGKKNGKFRGGTTSGQGFTFKDFSFNMPKRQFMGISATVTNAIIKRLKTHFKDK
jgi:phage gpG-like protein